MKSIHVIIVDYLKCDAAIQATNAVLQQNYDQEHIQITVIDNSCSSTNFEALKKELPSRCNLIQSKTNLGYTKATNLAASTYGAGSDIILLLNPDILMSDPDTFSRIIENFSDPTCAIVGPAQKNPDGSVPDTVRNVPTLSALILKRSPLRSIPPARNIVDRYLMTDFNYKLKQEVPWLQSSCVFINSKYWEKQGGLNEKYFLFMSDIEVCTKARSAGGKVIYDPSVTVYADGKRCSGGGFLSIFNNRAVRYHIKDAMKYYFSR